ncbi:MAG: trypsin-like peptidase domain-containing protein [Burkholderiaceae bacterium]|nr:trypsin-like peptidase domain-containing protein [Burkholderiaceae bacterium]
MMRRLWLVFAQATTIGLALLFIVSTLRPEWLSREPVPAAPLPAADSLGIKQAAVPDTRVNALNSYGAAVKLAAPAVVNVYTTKEVRRPGADDPLYRYFFGQGRGNDRVASLGSGVVATGDGFVLTNNHVVQAADEIAVALSDGRQFEAKLVGADPESDLAVLKIEARDLPAITFGRSDSLQVGDVVLAIGNPFDVGQTVTMGIVSALGRSNLGINTFENFIQTDAAINQGNSGGALVDSNGNLVGINTAIFSRTGGSIGIGFAIPSTIVTQVMDQLIKSGKVQRGYFGVVPEDINSELAQLLRLTRNEGVILKGVERASPARKAGLEPGDVMVSINGQPVINSRAMLNLISQLPPGSDARVKVMRAGKELDVQVPVGERPTPQLRH